MRRYDSLSKLERIQCNLCRSTKPSASHCSPSTGNKVEGLYFATDLDLAAVVVGPAAAGNVPACFGIAEGH